MDEVVAQYSTQVFRLAYRLSGNRHDAEDLTQEVFLRAFASRDQYESGNFGGWLHRITTNVFLDRARRDARLRIDPLTDRSELIPALTATPDHVVHDAALDPDIEEALAALPAQFRAAVILSDLEGLPHGEIAAALGIKPATVRSRVHRGRKMLRKELAHREPKAGHSRVFGPLMPTTS